MIVKEKTAPAPTDKVLKAGFDAEKQMAFYLRRAFSDAQNIYVFNDLRIVFGGEVAQIDHLVLHRFGLVLIESKSVSGTIEVNAHGEFVRVFGRKRQGMQSPITQVGMQRDLLQRLLNDHKESLRRKVLLGMLQAYFSNERFNVLVAVSDRGEIKRRGTTPPELVKEEAVSQRIQDIIRHHERTRGVGGMVRLMLADSKTARKLQDDDLAAFTDEELRTIRDFLLTQHTEVAQIEAPPIVRDVQPPAPPRPTLASRSESRACRHCESPAIEILYGKYGYYFKCQSCGKNTNINAKCPDCGGKARVKKSGRDFYQVCAACGNEQHFFPNPT